MAAANFVGSIPTSAGVAVCQFEPGNVKALLCGARSGAGCAVAIATGLAGADGGDVLAPAGEPMSAASERSVTIKIVARTRGDSFFVSLIRRDELTRCFRDEIFFNIIYQ